MIKIKIKIHIYDSILLLIIHIYIIIEQPKLFSLYLSLNKLISMFRKLWSAWWKTMGDFMVQRLWCCQRLWDIQDLVTCPPGSD